MVNELRTPGLDFTIESLAYKEDPNCANVTDLNPHQDERGMKEENREEEIAES